jgi:carbamoylphosphate synthase large subunit
MRLTSPTRRPYRVGSGVEFDWCTVSCVRALRDAGFAAIVVNNNPESVSTDFEESDHLYFEELNVERATDIYDAERASGMIVTVGGQIPMSLAIPLHRRGMNILGTSANDIGMAEVMPAACHCGSRDGD